MPKPIIPCSIAPPVSRHAHAAEGEAGTRLLVVSGQVGIRPDGTMREPEEGQHAPAWRNIIAVRAEAGKGAEDLIEVTACVTSRPGVPLLRTARDAALSGRAAVATPLLIVSGLAGIARRVEIAALAGWHA